MPRARASTIKNTFAEHFGDVWKLLSETTAFLARTDAFGQYEAQLRALRASLQSSSRSDEVARAVRTEIVDLRKALRLQGYDLSLASQRLRFEGFRNDACMREGFKRLVLFMAEGDAYWLSGEDNHIALSEFLEARIEASGGKRIRERHYLWFQRRGGELVFSGSDTESAEDFQRLVKIGEANELFLLGKLRKLS